MGYKLLDWLKLRDFDDANRASDRGVVSRYARRNTSVQAGSFLSEDDFTTMKREAPAVVSRLKKLRQKNVHI
jgi:hypothetical protein